jgi:hypothetical protein
VFVFFASPVLAEVVVSNLTFSKMTSGLNVMLLHGVDRRSRGQKGTEERAQLSGRSNRKAINDALLVISGVNVHTRHEVKHLVQRCADKIVAWAHDKAC